MTVAREEFDELTDQDSEGADDTKPVVVGRSVLLAAPIGAAASAVSIAYLWRVVHTGTVLDWAMWAVTAGIAGAYLRGLLDARTPLLVADDLGVRIRLGNQWRGLPWEAVEKLVVEPRRGRFRDGRLIIVPFSLGRALDGLDARARRHAGVNRKLYGAALAVPLGLVTRVSVAGERSLADRVAALSQGQADVVTLIETQPDPVAADSAPAVEGPEPRHRSPQAAVPEQRSGAITVDAPTGGRHRLMTGLGHLVSRLARSRSSDIDHPHEEPVSTPLGPPIPLRDPRPALRADITRDQTAGAAALVPHDNGVETVRRLPEDRHLRRPGSVDLVFEPVLESNVRPIAQLGAAVAPLVIDDFETHPAYDPVIGPELVAARHRVGLSVDELAERTRIRPHVIESIEVDDFAPCGGDVYARGHLRTLARVLGKDPAPLLAAYDNRYAAAPISARRVFEAELATGMTGSMRSTIGGPNWTLLVGVVLSLVLVWGVVRLFAGEPNEMLENPPSLSGTSPWPGYDKPDRAAFVPKVRLKLVAINSATLVTVRDRAGNVLFERRMVLGEQVTRMFPRPASVTAENGGAVSVSVAGHDEGLLGEADQPVEKVFG